MRLSLPALIFGLAIQTSAPAFAVAGTADRSSRIEASGLIIGFKGDEVENSKRADNPGVVQGPWASDRERMRAHWSGATRQGRERVTRLAREAGLPQGTAGEAGNAQLLRFERPLRGKDLDNALRRVRLHPDVAWVEPNVRVPRLAVPNDPLFSQQWHLQAPDVNNVAGLNLPSAWDLTTGAPVVVAVVDSGVRPHPDLAGKMLPGYDMVEEVEFAADGNGRDSDPTDPGDGVPRSGNPPAVQQMVDGGLCGDFRNNPMLSPSSWHGTFIAGQIAAITDHPTVPQGVAGLNWNARVLPVRVSGKCGALLSDLLDGLRWAAGLPVTGAPANPNPARVINLSFGGDTACTPGYQSTVDAVTAAGALVVVAAGNEDAALKRPADCDRVMAVTSVRRDGAKAGYASFGSRVALAAPGGSDELGGATLLLSTDTLGSLAPIDDNVYGYKQGTSFAAPQAAGVASLMLAVNPLLSPRQLIERMKAGARAWSTVSGLGGLPICGVPGARACTCTSITCGTGLLDANRAVQLATGPAVVIRPVGEVEPGTVVTLDGSQSMAIPGSNIVSYQWVQVSGPPATITSATSAVATATLVSETSYVFSLTVQDDFAPSRTGEDRVQVSVAMPPPPAGGGGGSMGQLWGLSLWAWVLAVLVSQRRRRARS